MAVFDPTQGFNAFAQGAQIGGGIRKSQTQRAMAPMLANNDYEGAMKYVAGRGDLEAMDYIRPMQEKAAEEAYNKELGGLLASGERQAAMQNAFAAGKLDLGTNIYNLDRTMKQGEQEDYRAAIKYLVDGSAEIMALPEDDPRRGEMAMQLASTSSYKDNPQFMQAVQRAVADGRLTDREINEFRNNLMSIEAQVAQQNWQTQYDTGREDRAVDLKYRDSQAAEDARRFGLTHGLQRDQFNWQQGTDTRDFNEGVRQFDLTYGLSREKAAADAASGKNREMRQDSKGMWRYVDDGSPVFPDDKPPNKPLIGSESMARVAISLPNAKKSVSDLRDLVFGETGNKPTGWFGQQGAEGYDPSSDWGASAINAIPDFGALKGVARFVGGEDYRLFSDSYAGFEAAMLPILSGAAITPSEGERLMRALEIRPGDSSETKQRKLSAMESMVKGAELAAVGDMEGFMRALDEASAISSGSDQTSGGGLENASDDELFNILGGR